MFRFPRLTNRNFPEQVIFSTFPISIYDTFKNFNYNNESDTIMDVEQHGFDENTIRYVNSKDILLSVSNISEDFDVTQTEITSINNDIINTGIFNDDFLKTVNKKLQEEQIENIKRDREHNSYSEKDIIHYEEKMLLISKVINEHMTNNKKISKISQILNMDTQENDEDYEIIF